MTNQANPRANTVTTGTGNLHQQVRFGVGIVGLKSRVEERDGTGGRGRAGQLLEVVERASRWREQDERARHHEGEVRSCAARLESVNSSHSIQYTPTSQSKRRHLPSRSLALKPSRLQIDHIRSKGMLSTVYNTFRVRNFGNKDGFDLHLWSLRDASLLEMIIPSRKLQHQRRKVKAVKLTGACSICDAPEAF